MIYYEDKTYEFFELFDEKTGMLIRSNIKGTQIEPYIRSFPELIDIGIMGHCETVNVGMCKAAGVDCYQNAWYSKKENMPIDCYEVILKQCKNKVFQIALGGCGDPNKHERFDDILSLTRAYGIIPNMTTSGYNLIDNEVESIKRYCGAVAVSYYSRLGANGEELNIHTIDAIKKLVDTGCQTNIHFVISSSSIAEATYRLKYDIWPTGISAIIFILYKPVGLGKKEKMIKSDIKLQQFLDVAIKQKHPYRVGFDTCFTSALVEYGGFIDMHSIDACEAARFSMYIDCEMNAYPCSFDSQTKKYQISLKNKSILDAWNSEIFNEFRNKANKKCTTCHVKHICNGGCSLELGIELCNNL